MIKRPTMMLCCDCGYAVDKSKMFIKQYRNTAICLCKTCSRKLSEEIQEALKETSSPKK